MSTDEVRLIDESLAQREVQYAFHRSLQTPTPIASLAFGHSTHLFTGSEDGTLRVYNLSTYKVIKAVRGLNAAIPSIVCVKRSGSELRDAWISCGKSVYRFKMDAEKMIQGPDDALIKVDVTDAEGDEINEVRNAPTAALESQISINYDKTQLAFSLDSGIVGVVELEGHTVKRMGNSHGSVCACVKFVPERPKELVSAGYDHAFLHFDCTQGNIMTRRTLSTSTNLSDSISLSPPFIMSTAFSSDGIMAAGTADGRLWLGYGGQKVPGSKKKKFWEGLSDAKQLEAKVAGGPIVSLAFIKPDTLVTSTMLGVISVFDLEYNPDKHSLHLYQIWHGKVQVMEKVNALICDERRIILAGLDKNDKGVIEIWHKEKKDEGTSESREDQKEQKEEINE
ncbi:hypothetical protein AX16_008840 [Volvariella volvacea WC 439]|nr:hypothetical protein AX16_008840 [Volvariella volvacea WC 439]